MNVMNGKKIARELEGKLKLEVLELTEKYKRAPKLIVVLVGNNPASLSYVKSKEKACKRVGIDGETLHLDESITESELINLVHKLNKDDSVDAMIIQLPLPSHIDPDTVLNEVDSSKDVDGLSLLNAGKLMNRQKGFLPATPKGIMILLDYFNIDIPGKEAVVIGRSNLVGCPTGKLLINAGATVTICHRHTKDLKKHTLQADILIVATGVVHLVKADMIKPGAIVIDVGITRVGDKLVGDVDYENVKEVASLITPVPGGVGPMTIFALMENVVEAFKLRQ